MTVLDLILGILCAYRLTQLVVYDTILDPITSRLASLHPKIDELLCCPHCSGFWCAVVTVVALATWPPLRFGVWVFAIAGAVSIIEHATGWLGPRIIGTEVDDGETTFRNQ